MSQNFRQEEPMSATLTDDQIREWIVAAEKREMMRSGTKQPEARAALSNDLRVGYWTLTNLLRRRLKGLRGDVRDKIKAGIIHHLKDEMRRLERELFLVQQCGSNLSEAKILQAANALEQAHAFLKGD